MPESAIRTLLVSDPTVLADFAASWRRERQAGLT